MLKRKKTQKNSIKNRPANRSTERSPLKKGDLIELVAPASSAPEGVLEKGAEFLESWGFRVHFEKYMIDNQMYLSNTDELRLKYLINAFKRKETKAIWCLRGGYGSIRLLPHLKKIPKPKNEKLLIGLSDISSLHCFVNQFWGWKSLHGPLLDRLALNKLSKSNLEELNNCLTRKDYSLKFENLEPLNNAALRKKVISSKVVGGNLVVVSSTIGTDFQINTNKKILFLEEISERAYRIDRCLHQMEQAGLFKNVSAVLFGDLVNCEELNKLDYAWPTIKNFFSRYKFPVFRGVESGHAEVQRPIFFNTECELYSGENAYLQIKSAFV